MNTADTALIELSVEEFEVEVAVKISNDLLVDSRLYDCRVLLSFISSPHHGHSLPCRRIYMSISYRSIYTMYIR